MSNLRRFEVEVVFEMRKTYYIGAADTAAAKDFGVKGFRNEFAEAYEAVAPSASELEVFADELE